MSHQLLTEQVAAVPATRGGPLTIYELFIENKADGLRLEVPLRGIGEAVVYYRRLSEMADGGTGTLTDSSGAHIILDDLTVDDATRLLAGVDAVWIGRPGDPGRGPSMETNRALARFSPGAALEATYWEM